MATIHLEDVASGLLEDSFTWLPYFVFLDYSQEGHARKKDDALDASGMSRSFDGVQPKIRSSKIVDECLGPFQCYTESW